MYGIKLWSASHKILWNLYLEAEDRSNAAANEFGWHLAFTVMGLLLESAVLEEMWGGGEKVGEGKCGLPSCVMSQPQLGNIYSSVTRNGNPFLSLPAQSLFWARSKSIEIPLNWAKLKRHPLPGTWQTPCLPSSLLIIYVRVYLALCKMPQERKLLQLLSWGCQYWCIPTAVSMERFCWR